ncbi:uncharacterized protein LOC144020715 [Festucalex cinctus]
MSTGDFETKCTSFMESAMKAIIAETTKLFEAMVDELKADLSKVKTENEVLQTTCRRMEDAKTLAVSRSCQSVRPRMRDTAVQCELLPGDSLLEVQPLEQSIDEQNKQCDKDYLVYILKDHDYIATMDANSKLTVSLPTHKGHKITYGCVLCLFLEKAFQMVLMKFWSTI